MAAIYTNILNAIVTQIEGLSLTDIGVADIILFKVPLQREVNYPCVQVFPVPERLPVGTNVRNDVYYGTGVALVQESNQDLTANIDRINTWRQKIRRKFHWVPLTGVTEVSVCFVEPGPVFDHEAFKNQIDLSGLTVYAKVRETTDTS